MIRILAFIGFLATAGSVATLVSLSFQKVDTNETEFPEYFVKLGFTGPEYPDLTDVTVAYKRAVKNTEIDSKEAIEFAIAYEQCKETLHRISFENNMERLNYMLSLKEK